VFSSLILVEGQTATPLLACLLAVIVEGFYFYRNLAYFWWRRKLELSSEKVIFLDLL